MARFLFLALPLLVLALAAGHGIFSEYVGVDFGILPAKIRVGTWALEALALTALFLLIHGEVDRPKDSETSPVATGVLAAWIAWVFRGALLVLALAAAGHSTSIWWRRALSWWAIYTVCGVVLGLLARSPKKDEPLPSAAVSPMAPTTPVAPTAPIAPMAPMASTPPPEPRVDESESAP